MNGADVTQWLGKRNVGRCKIIQFVGKCGEVSELSQNCSHHLGRRPRHSCDEFKPCNSLI